MIYGFAILDADPRLVRVAAGASIIADDVKLDGNLFPVLRAGAVAAGFALDEAQLPIGSAVRGQLGARASTRAWNGLTLIDQVTLRKAQWDAATCWTGPGSREALTPAMRGWSAHVLLASHAPARLAMRTTRRPAGSDTIDINLLGDITARESLRIANKIFDARDSTLSVTIDSRGGDLEGALRIYAHLSDHPHLVEVTIFKAESAAALVACAGDHRRIAPDGHVMVHEPYINADGPLGADAMLAHAKELARCSTEIAEHIAARTRQPLVTVKRWIKDETTFNAGRAVVLGFAHEIADEIVPEKPRKVRARFKPIQVAACR